LLREIMRYWANCAVPTTEPVHWEFSSANGQLGGIDLATLVELGGNRRSAGDFGTFANGGNSLHYCPMEPDLAGLMSPEEVPDLWFADDARWLFESGRQVLDDMGSPVYVAETVSTWTVEEIVRRFGVRAPGANDAQKAFRAALILVVDPCNTAHVSTLDESCEAVALVSGLGDDVPEGFRKRRYSFPEATGGRATLTMDRLCEVQHAVLDEAAGGKPGAKVRVVKGRGPAVDDHIDHNTRDGRLMVLESARRNS